MDVIPNKWIEKEKKKKAVEEYPQNSWSHCKKDKSVKPHTNVACAIMRKTLRGVRK